MRLKARSMCWDLAEACCSISRLDQSAGRDNPVRRRALVAYAYAAENTGRSLEQQLNASHQ